MLKEETAGEEPTEGTVSPTKRGKAAKKPAKPAEPPEPKCACCGKPMSRYDLSQGDNHGNCDGCAGERAAIARTIVHALCVDNVDSEDVAQRAVSYADHLLLELKRRPIGGGL